MKTWVHGLCLAAVIGVVAPTAAQTADPTAELEPYRKRGDFQGRIVSIGSSTVTRSVHRWAELFRALQPGVTFEITAGGSGMAPPALLEGACHLAPMSRVMSREEKAAFAATHGVEPTEVVVGIDAIAVYVARENPVEGLTIRQLSGIFSRSLGRGGSAVERWGDVGLSGEWLNRPVVKFSLAERSGTTATFREVVLRGGEFRLDVDHQRVPSGAVQGAGAEPGGIAFASVLYATKRTRWVPIAGGDGAYYEPSHENCVTMRYPLARPLYIYVHRPRDGALPAHVVEFLRFVVSQEGQRLMMGDGGYALNREMQEASLRAIGG